MVVFVIENAPENLRGELTRWLLETKPGVFIGNVNAVVREKLWEKITGNPNCLDAIVAFSSNTEQGFDMKMTGNPYRSVVELDGIKLIKIRSYQ